MRSLATPIHIPAWRHLPGAGAALLGPRHPCRLLAPVMLPAWSWRCAAGRLLYSMLLPNNRTLGHQQILPMHFLVLLALALTTLQGTSPLHLYSLSCLGPRARPRVHDLWLPVDWINESRWQNAFFEDLSQRSWKVFNDLRVVVCFHCSSINRCATSVSQAW